MKGRRSIVGAALILLFVLALGASAQDKYVPKANEELYGTWINENAQPQKLVNTPDGWKQYFRTSNEGLVMKFSERMGLVRPRAQVQKK